MQGGCEVTARLTGVQVMTGSRGGPLEQLDEVGNAMRPMPEVFCLPLFSLLGREKD